MSGSEVSLAVKGWFCGCLSASAVLFISGLVTTSSASGMTPGLLLVGLFLSLVHFAFIAIFTAVPAGLMIWIAHATEIRNVVASALFGTALGWFGQYVFNPLGGTLWHFVVAGLAAGVTYWWVAGRRRPDPTGSGA
jgi:hypothetical protein